MVSAEPRDCVLSEEAGFTGEGQESRPRECTANPCAIKEQSLSVPRGQVEWLDRLRFELKV